MHDIKKIVTIQRLSSSEIEKLPAIYLRATFAIDVFNTSTNFASISNCYQSKAGFRFPLFPDFSEYCIYNILNTSVVNKK